MLWNLIRLLAAVSYFIVPMVKKIQLMDCHYGEQISSNLDKISKDWTFFAFLVLCPGLGKVYHCWLLIINLNNFITMALVANFYTAK